MRLTFLLTRLALTAALLFALSAPAQTDPYYRALRDATPGEGLVVENIVLQRNAATITLKSGNISFLPAVPGRVTGAVFTGSGALSLKAGNALESRYLRQRTGADTLAESFDEMVLFFTDATEAEIRKQATRATPAGNAAAVLAKLRRNLRKDGGEHADNVEAELLAELYHPTAPGIFSAYFDGKRLKQVEFHIRPRGALPFLPATEEVALLGIEPDQGGHSILYLAHLGGAIEPAGSRQIVDVKHYAIDTTVARNKRLNATAAIQFEATADGPRVLKFGLLPSLRVSKVELDGTATATFIQEDKEEDGSFHVVLSEGLKKGAQHKLTVAYAGDRVIQGEGGGNFAVGARTSWYPSANAFTDYATFDLTFRTPKDFTLVAVGTPEPASKDGDWLITKWKCAAPVAVAGFNYGRFKSKELSDQRTSYKIEGHAAQEVPDYLRNPGESSSMNPARMMDKAMSEAQVSVQLFTHWFGPAPYGRLAVTQQPDFGSGQSWPTLVYLPVSAFLDATERWKLLGSDTFRFSDFIQEVTAHEVAHQWWGHIVGWKSYRDQWLSEGFSDFSASLFIQATNKGDKEYREYLKKWSEAILEKNQFGMTANDAGPIAMGVRLSGPRTPGAYGRIAYAKGGFVLHMLRSLMFDPQRGGDKPFIAMMQEFVKTHSGGTASTADFRAIVEKHMQPHMNVTRDGSMKWFFDQWIYGTEIPSYKTSYSLTPQSDGKKLLKLQVTQSGVGASFRMPVRLYFVLNDNRVLPLGRVAVLGASASQPIEVALPAEVKDVAVNYNYDVLSAANVMERAK